MKLLLDENLPKRLKEDFKEHEIFTVSDKNWNGIKNGKLLQQMVAEGFDALLTFDKNLQYQQNFKQHSIAVLVLAAANNTYTELTKLTPKVQQILKANALPAGPILITI